MLKTVSSEELMEAMITAESEEDDMIRFQCVAGTDMLTAIIEHYDVPGKLAEGFGFSISYWRRGSFLFETSPIYNAGQVFNIFTRFAYYSSELTTWNIEYMDDTL
jgi:hypothetical protein